MRLAFVDLNRDLVKAVKELGIKSYWTDYFLKSRKFDNPVFMTASNPAWTFGGGIDAIFLQNYRGLCEQKQTQGGGNERIGNICFTITVGDNLRVSKEKVQKAIKFALDNTAEDETLMLMGSGTGIGGLSKEEYIEALKEALEEANIKS